MVFTTGASSPSAQGTKMIYFERASASFLLIVDNLQGLVSFCFTRDTEVTSHES